MDLVIIDDGVNEKYLNSKLKQNLEVNDTLEVIERKEDHYFSHGTICAAIILKYAPEASISSIKVLNAETGRGKKERLLTALRWCYEKHVRLINLSIGTTQYQDFDEIRVWISRLYRSGCIIIAAYNNKNIYTVPASFECTIGVRCGFQIENTYRVNMNEYEHYVEVRGDREMILRNQKTYVSKPFNSFAAPYITAVVYNIKKKNDTNDLFEIWKKLVNDNNEILYHFPDFIDSAVIIDLNGAEEKALFYFEISAEYNIDTIKDIEAIRGQVYIVMLAEGSDQMAPILRKINTIKRNVKGIFCCFNYKKIQETKQYDLYNKIWHEQYYLDKYAQSNTLKDIKIPLIYIYADRKILIELLQDLKKKFIVEGYLIRIVGEFRCAYLYGFEYSDCEENRKRIIHNVYDRYNCDVIICGIISNNIILEDADLCITIEMNKIVIFDRSDRFSIFNEKKENYMNIVYEKILNKFV